MIDKIILEVKKAENTADRIIREANDKAELIIDNANKEAEKLIERVKEEAKKDGKMIIGREERIARVEADNIIKKSEIEKEELSIKSLKNSDNAIKIVINKIMEGK